MREKLSNNRIYKVALSLLTVAAILAITVSVILYAEGYRLENRGLTSTGQLVLKSTPDAASVYINNKFVAATNSNLNLAPGEYRVKIVKDGYSSWEKKLKIEAAVVTPTDAILFPQVPEFRRITSTGAINPTLSPDGTKIAYGVDSSTAYPPKNGVFVMSISNNNNLFFGSNTQHLARDIPGVTEFSKGKYLFSPDGKQLLVWFDNTETQNETVETQNVVSAYLLDTSRFNGEEIPDASLTLDLTLETWQKEKKQESANQFNLLKKDVRAAASSSMEILSWSLDASKFMYCAKQNSVLPIIIKPRLVGANSVPEQRKIKKGNLYIYDIKEDRNYPLGTDNKQQTTNNSYPMWLATSRHYVTVEDRKIFITEYDGTNRTVAYSGSFEKDFIAPSLSGDRIFFLTSFSRLQAAPNLYALLIR